MTPECCGDEVLLCRCQEVTRGEVRTVVRCGARTLRDVKLATEAMMGLCQGRTCRREIVREIAAGGGADAAELVMRCARAPVRPVPLGALAGDEGDR